MTNTIKKCLKSFFLLGLLYCLYPTVSTAQIAKDSTVFKTGYITVNGAKLFYKEAGQGKPMLFLHGMKWDQALSYAKKIMGDEFPENSITVYLVAISEIKINMELSSTVKNAGDKLIETILKEL